MALAVGLLPGSPGTARHSTPSAPPHVVHHVQSRYNQIFVVDQGRYRYLRFGTIEGDDQSMVDLVDGVAVPMEYIRVMTVALAYRPAPRQALMVGLGGGTLPMALHRRDGRLRLDVVEIDPEVLAIARRFFSFTTAETMPVHLVDGRSWLAAAPGRYDLILLDAYGPDGIPAHLTTAEFFSTVAAALAGPAGLVVANLAANDQPVERRILAGLAAALPNLRCYPVRESANVIVLASRQPLPSAAQAAAAARALTRERPLPYELAEIAARPIDCPAPTEPYRDPPAAR